MNDADGTPANIHYQWFADGKPIAGATAQTFTLTAAQQGAKIAVQATYTDLAQHAEAPQSAATAAVSGLPPQNHAPTDITLSAATVAEGKDGATVGKLTTTDPDAGDAHRYTVSDARFEVTADGTLKLKAGLHLDYAAEKTIALTVTATDAGGLATQKTFTLSVQDDPNYPAPNPQPPSAATLTVRETDDAVSGTLHVGKIAAGEALTVGETTLNAAKLAELAHQPRTVIDDAKGTLTLTGYDAASGTLTYRYDPKEHASPNDQQATVDFIIGREAFRGTNGVGVQPFNPRWAGDDSTAIEESYARAAALGVKWVRITAGWNQVQPQDDGSYDWRYVDDAVRLAQKYGMKVLMQVMGTPNWASDIGDLPAAQQQKLAQEGYWTSTHAPKPQHDAAFARFFGEAVKRYSAQGIHDYEFWNEPGNKFWRDTWANPNPNPEHYTRLLKLVYEAAHAADAEANVLAGGMTVGDSRADGSYISPQEFLERMYKAGAQGYFDALSHHPYGILAKDYKDNGWAQMNGDIVAPGAGEKTLMQIMQAHGDGGKLIWPSEVGWDAMFAGLAETYQANVLKTLLEWQQKADYTGPLLLYQAQNDRAAYVQGILNRDDNGDGIVDVNIDTNGDGIPDANIDADHNNRPDLLDAADREAYYGFWKNDGSEKPAVDAIKQGTPQTPAAATLNITIENVDTPAPQPQNHAPDDITLSTATVAEGKDGTTVGKLTTHDPDSGDTHTYKTSDDRFEVAADGTLKLKAGQHLDYASEPTVKLTVTATDAGGLSTQKTFTLSVQDDPNYPAPNPQPNPNPQPPQNHAPDDITLSASQVAEGQDGATVGKLTTHDPDSGDTHTYKTSDDRFEVAADGTLKLKAGQHLDYAAEKTVALTVTATDAGGLSTQKTFTLHTTNPADTFARDNLPPGAAYQIVADLGAAKTAIAANPTLQNLIISDGNHHALLQKNSTGYSDNMPPGWTLTCKNHIPAVAFHDGGADLAPALNAAAQAAKTLQLGIELPAQREYQLGSQIVLENGVPYLHGNGSTLAVQNSVNEAALKLPNGASQGEISGLTLNMNAAPGVHGILGYDLHDYRIHDNHILHLGQRPGHPGYGITVYSGSGHTENITVENNHISAKPSNGAHADAPVGIAFNGAQQPGNPQWRDAKAPVWRQYVEDGTVAEADPSRTIKHITVRGNQVSGTYYGVAFSTVSDSEISGNHLHHNTRNISLQDRSNHNTVRDNILTDAHSSAIHIAYASSDNHIENNHIMTTHAGGQAILQAYQGSKNNHYHNNHIDVAHDATTNFMYTATDSSGTTYRDNIASGRVSRASIGAESIWDKAGAGDEKSAYGNNMQDPNLYDGDITHGGGHGALTGLTISGNILAPEPTFAGAPITYLGADSSHGLHGDKTLHGDLDATLNDNTWLGADGREAIRQHQSGDSHVHLHGNGITHADGTTYHHGTTAYSIGDYTLANDETTLYLLGTHATSGSGNSGDNQLYGNAQTNRLSGGAGNDHLDGGYGADTLTGGAGADTFTFASLLDGKNIDTITDFNAGEGDKIALNQAVFGRLGDNWYAAAGQHITHTTRVYQQGDTLYHDPDGSGSAYSATAFAKVNVTLEEGHFSLI